MARNGLFTAILCGHRLLFAARQFCGPKRSKKTLADFKGKIVYLDLWATWCGPCLAKFPHQEQLLKRLKVLELDTAIQFININIDDKKSTWKKSMRKYKPVGINLYTSDAAILNKWNIESLPAYILLDPSGRVLGKVITGPDEASIDWILYCATKGVAPVEAIWKEFTQNKLMERHRSAAAFTDPDYAEWFRRLLPAFLAYNTWRQEHHGQKGR
jgi:thiol-disulfide isomerase/thioredoxin